MVAITGGKMAPFPGGVVVKNCEGEIIGAVGVSGASGDENEYSAIRGVVNIKMNLVSVPENHSCTTIKVKEWNLQFILKNLKYMQNTVNQYTYRIRHSLRRKHSLKGRKHFWRNN